MKNIVISENDFFKLQQAITELRQKLYTLQDRSFIEKINIVYQYINESKSKSVEKSTDTLSIKRGAAKHLITFIADDFNAPLDDFKEYM